MNMLNYDLIDFYASREFKTVMAKYQLLTELIANKSITFCDNENFLENKNTLKSKSWMYITTPLLRHPLQESKENIDKKKESFIQFLPIPPLHDKWYLSDISGQAIPTIDYYLFEKLIIHIAEYQSMVDSGLENVTKIVKEKIQALFTLITTFYQHEKIISWWELVVLSGIETPYSMYEEYLPPLTKSTINISEYHKANKGFNGVRDTIMLDNDNLLFLFDEYITHFTLSTSESLSILTPQFNFYGIKDKYCTFYHEDGFIHYFWKEKQWSNRLSDNTEYILLSPEEDEYLFHLQKKLALPIPELMNRAIIKVTDTSGDFCLMMDKEAHGGIYNLQTLSKIVNTGQLNWYSDTEEIILKDLKNEHHGSQNKVAAFWMDNKQYKLLAYGKIIVNNKLTRNIPANILNACFSPDGDYLILVSDEKCFVLETTTYTCIMDFV